MKSRCVVPCVRTFLITMDLGCISLWTEIRQNHDQYNPSAESLVFRRSAACAMLTNASHSFLSTAGSSDRGLLHGCRHRGSLEVYGCEASVRYQLTHSLYLSFLKISCAADCLLVSQVMITLNAADVVVKAGRSCEFIASVPREHISTCLSISCLNRYRMPTAHPGPASPNVQGPGM